MKKIILLIVLFSICFSNSFPISLTSEIYAETSKISACKIKTLAEEGSTDAKKFVEYILEKEHLDVNSSDVSIEYYKDGTASVTTVLENGDAEIYSSLTESQANQIYKYQQSNSGSNGERGLVTESIFWAIVQVYNIIKKAGKVLSYSCKIAQITGNGNPCAYLTDQVIQGLINSTQAQYEVSQYIYKDPSCPYPINSLQCSQPPYAYTKTYLKRVN